MSTDSSFSTGAEVPVETLFETTMRGYHKRQVEDYVAWLLEKVHAAQNEAGEHRRELAIAREEVVINRQQLVNRPAHEEVSERLAQILRLADEEADTKRDKAAQDAEAAIEEARGQAAAIIEAANGEAEKIVVAVREQTENELAGAKSEALRLHETSTQASAATLADAAQRASAILEDANRRTASITALQDERLAAVLGVHTDAVRRLDEIRTAIGTLLGQEEIAGAPDAGVEHAPLPIAGQPLTPEEAAATATAPASAADADAPTVVGDETALADEDLAEDLDADDPDADDLDDDEAGDDELAGQAPRVIDLTGSSSRDSSYR